MKYQDIKISVIIPVYNREATIRAAIESVLSQTFEPYEIIIVDDGSSDQSGQIVKSIKSSILKYFYHENKGGALARNTGMQNATGNWIAFLDSDDTWRKKKLEKQIELLSNRPNMDFVHTNRTHCFLDGQENGGRIGNTEQELTDKQYLLRHWAIKLSTVIIKKELLNEIGGKFRSDLRFCHDYEFLWKAVIASSEIGYIEDPLVRILLTNDGISRANPYEKTLYAHIAALESVIRWLKERKVKNDYYSKILKERQIDELKQLLRKRYYEKDISNLIKDFIFFIKATSFNNTCFATFSIMKSVNFKKILAP
jgi:glycosyltransferase involved in cell wall biosynthesis